MMETKEMLKKVEEKMPTVNDVVNTMIGGCLEYGCRKEVAAVNVLRTVSDKGTDFLETMEEAEQKIDEQTFDFVEKCLEESELSAGEKIEEVCKVRRFIHSLKLNRIITVGYCIGGIVAVAAATKLLDTGIKMGGEVKIAKIKAEERVFKKEISAYMISELMKNPPWMAPVHMLNSLHK